jgi:hypothetical protein
MSGTHGPVARAGDGRIVAAEVGLSRRLTGDRVSTSPMSSPHVDVSSRQTAKWTSVEYNDRCLLGASRRFQDCHNQHGNAHQRLATALSGLSAPATAPLDA